MDTRKAVKTYHRNLAIVLAIIVAIFAAIPLVVDKPYIINIFVLTFYMSTLSRAWNILGGITGQNSLGLAAYMGLGAYVCCLVVTKTGMNPWVAAVLDMLVVGVVAGVIFFPSLILRGPYFTLVSIAFAESACHGKIHHSHAGAAAHEPAAAQNGIRRPQWKQHACVHTACSRCPEQHKAARTAAKALPGATPAAPCRWAPCWPGATP